VSARSIWKGPGSLFGRFLAAQLITVLAVVLMLGLMFYVDRNLTLARLIGERWGPALLAASGTAPPPLAGPSDGLTVLRSLHVPADATIVPDRIPRNKVLRDTLRRHGLAVERLALQKGPQGPILWLEVSPPQGQRVWLGLNDPLIEPALPLRVLVAVGLGSLLIIAVSWQLARWLTGPLNGLRQRMSAHRPGQLASHAVPQPVVGASTEIQAMETAWNEMMQRQERFERERALMLAGMSHDLRGPLSRIRLAAALMPDAPGVAERRDSIERNVGQADRLIQSFLDHARTSALPLDQQVNLRALAQELVTARADAQRPVQLCLPDAPLPLVLAKANPILLECMLNNLLDNAWTHGKPPVSLRLDVLDGQALCVDVQDSGDGIPPEHREAVLQAFFRVDPSRGSPGAGLGLAIVREGVERLGGRIELSYSPGRHQVRLVLPLATQASASCAQ
jgi:two-component system osmolarity sensor histidine kinase EnvZ